MFLEIEETDTANEKNIFIKSYYKLKHQFTIF